MDKPLLDAGDTAGAFIREMAAIETEDTVDHAMAATLREILDDCPTVARLAGGGSKDHLLTLLEMAYRCGNDAGYREAMDAVIDSLQERKS